LKRRRIEIDRVNTPQRIAANKIKLRRERVSRRVCHDLVHCIERELLKQGVVFVAANKKINISASSAVAQHGGCARPGKIYQSP
jgi:hypothetical protein